MSKLNISLTTPIVSQTTTNQTLVDRGFGLTEKLLFSPAGSGWAAFLVLAIIFGLREWQKYQFYKRFKQVDIAKVATSIGGAWQKTMKIGYMLESSARSADRKFLAIERAIDTVKQDVTALKSQVDETKTISQEVGDELSGQLHDIERLIKKLEN